MDPISLFIYSSSRCGSLFTFNSSNPTIDIKVIKHANNGKVGKKVNTIFPITFYKFQPKRLQVFCALLKAKALEGNLLHGAITHSVMKPVENINRVIPHRILRASCLTNDLS